MRISGHQLQICEEILNSNQSPSDVTSKNCNKSLNRGKFSTKEENWLRRSVSVATSVHFDTVHDMILWDPGFAIIRISEAWNIF